MLVLPPLLLCFSLPLAASGCVAPPSSSSPALATSEEAGLPGGQDDLKEEYDRRRRAAKGNLEQLWNLANWCEANGLIKEFRSCLRAVLKLDDSDKKAHELLGHVFYDGQWFVSEKKREAYQRRREAEARREEERRAKEQGLVKYGDQWVRPDEIPLLEKGFVKDESGTWIDPEEQKKLAEGWLKQDLEWVSPGEKDKLDQGLWKCGKNWLGLQEANAYHSEVERCWKIPGAQFVVYSTCDRRVAEKALLEADDAYADLVRLFGVHPPQRPHFLVLNSRDQYGRFAGGDPAAQRPGVETRGLSSIHGAFFADAWFDFRTMEFLGAGVCYWDTNDERDSQFGRLWARHAAGQSFVESIDPSPKTIARLVESMGAGGFAPQDFWAEKALAPWLRWGAAAYVERYFIDKSGAAANNPYQLREWSVSNIVGAGGLDPLDTILDFAVSVEDPEGSRKLINEVGLLVAFLLDGECAPLEKDHKALKAAIKKAREDPKNAKAVARAIAKLEKTLKSKEDELRAFAKL